MIPESILAIFDFIIFASMVLCIWRLAIGPSVADRMVAVDLLGMLVALLMVSHAIRSRDEALLDVVLVFSVVAFFGTVALARHLQREIDEPTDQE